MIVGSPKGDFKSGKNIQPPPQAPKGDVKSGMRGESGNAERLQPLSRGWGGKVNEVIYILEHWGG